jgi:hypothetical protein
MLLPSSGANELPRRTDILGSMSKTTVHLRLSPRAQERLAALEAHFLRTSRHELFLRELEDACRKIAEQVRDSPQAGRRSMALESLSCVLYYSSSDEVAHEVIVDEFTFPIELRSGFLDRPGAGVPRRFGMGAMLGFTVAFALLYGFLKWLEAPLALMLILVVYFVVLGLGQALLFGGRDPRRASMVVGAFFCPVVLVATMLWFRSRPLIDEIASMMCGIVLTCSTVGPATGYLLGGLLAGLFLKNAPSGSDATRSFEV